MIAPIRSRQQPEDRDQLRRDLAVELDHLAELADADPDLAADYRDLANSIRRGVVAGGIVDQLDRLETRLETVLADKEV